MNILHELKTLPKALLNSFKEHTKCFKGILHLNKPKPTKRKALVYQEPVVKAIFKRKPMTLEELADVESDPLVASMYRKGMVAELTQLSADDQRKANRARLRVLDREVAQLDDFIAVAPSHVMNDELAWGNYQKKHKALKNEQHELRRTIMANKLN